VSSKRIPLGIKKIYTIREGSPTATVRYLLTGRGQEEYRFYLGVEANLTLLAGDDPQRYLLLGDGTRRAMGSPGEIPPTDGFSIVDEFSGFTVSFHLSRAAQIAGYGVQTASNSEGGLERTYQGTCIVCFFPVVLRADEEYGVEMTMTIAPFGGR
jgi:hypothetical protein